MNLKRTAGRKTAKGTGKRLRATAHGAGKSARAAITQTAKHPRLAARNTSRAARARRRAHDAAEAMESPRNRAIAAAGGAAAVGGTYALMRARKSDDGQPLPERSPEVRSATPEARAAASR